MVETASPTDAIRVHQLVKRYGEFVAVNGLELTIRRGEFLSLLGPNGAGKSTTLRILTTLMPATSGQVTILGHESPRDNAIIRPLLGLVPQEIALYTMLSVRRNLQFFASLYPMSPEVREQRVTRLIADVGLTDKTHSAIETLSGGMQRRANIAAALVHDPEIVFLDEPTVGLDPISRSAIWDMLRALRARGKTLVLTTHYMEEAETLSDRVAIVDHGRVVAVGAPADLVRATGIQACVQLVLDGDAAAYVEAVRQVADVTGVAADGGRLEVHGSSGAKLLPPLLQRLLDAGAVPRSVEVTTPDLGAVFLHYTGRQLRE